MKQHLLLLLIACAGLSVNAQTYRDIDPGIVAAVDSNGNIVFPFRDNHAISFQPKDTLIKSILFYIDTTVMKLETWDSNIGVHYQNNVLVYWMYGYEYFTWSVLPINQQTDYGELLRYGWVKTGKYFNENKKPLPKNIVVINSLTITIKE
ncbi:MAG: hypothetical protein JST87_05335 [Bacteroidetes bacterium]|nr:hypothetical protein [Bacteroidota bacterium]